MTIFHQPILAETIIEYLNVDSSSVIADLTTGEGGHASLIAPLISDGRLICLDRDRIILEKAQNRLKQYNNITYICDTYDKLSEIRERENIPLFDGILVDMGISMFHFKGASRGFSFEDDTLDMRLSQNSPISAAQVINTYNEKDLADIFYYYGEERNSRKIARMIVKKRPFSSAKSLASSVLQEIRRHGKIHPATKIFQGLRIYVNKELEITEKFLDNVVKNLAPGGILCILSFHSLEDRLVKKYFRSYVLQNLGTLAIVKPLTPSLDEMKKNPASRSAKLRIFKRNK